MFFQWSSSLIFFLSAIAIGANPPTLDQQIRDAAKRAFLDPKLIQAIIKIESNFKPKAVSKKGAMGLMQVMPSTADACGIIQPFHAMNNLMGASRCLRRLVNNYRGDLKLALAAYNAGEGAVMRFKGIPPYSETVEYVEKVLLEYRRLKGK